MTGDVAGDVLVSDDDTVALPDAANSERPGLRGRIRRDESGLALVWMSLFLMVLIGFAALAVDIGHGYQVAQKAQNAADAAALAGTIYLPGDLATAQSTAVAVAAANGFPSSASVQVNATQAGSASRLKVTITDNVKTWFAKAIGFSTMTVSRSATADYRPPVAMGSPNPQYGNDPESSCAPAAGTSCPQYPNLWGNVTSFGTEKQNGNAYTSGQCNNSADDCSSTNADYDANGYYYAIHFTQASTVTIQVFDPGFVAVGNNCGAGGSGDYFADLPSADGLTSAQVRGWPAGATPGPATRYQPVNSLSDSPTTAHPGTRYCTGDQPFSTNSQGVAISMPTSSYTVLGPSTVSGQPQSAPQASGCSKWTFPGVAGTPSNSIANQLVNAANTKVAVSPTPQYLGTYFRQWFSLCTITGTAGSDYFLQVNGDSTGNGNNNFAIRASGGTAGAVSVYGNGKMAMFANAGAGVSTQFYLTRIPTSDAGHTLSLNLFDIGDAASGSTGTLTVVPPTDSNVGASFSGCTATSETFSPSINSSCALTNVSSTNYQGRWVTVNVPIPSTYKCTDGSPTGCWFRINYLFTGGVNDVTSWSAVLGGDPVRIVQ